MTYIDFGNTPVKESITIKSVEYDCENCIHRIFIPGGAYRCSIFNRYMYKTFIYNSPCNYKNTVIDKRKVICGVFNFDKNGKSIWTGILSIADIINLDDTGLFTMFYKDIKNTINTKAPHLKDVFTVPCIIAESRNGNPFIKLTNLIEDNVIKEIIDDANKKFLNQ